ncbi:MAG: hypothetical protein QXT84_00750 [Candidatus Bathyarchaeia archaeon]
MHALPIAGALSRVEAEASRIGSFGISFLRRTASMLSNPAKGLPLAIGIIKLFSFAKTDPSAISGPIAQFGEWLMNYDPTLVIGRQPEGPFYIDWNAVNSILPDLQCGALDVGCLIQNGLRALGRAILGALYGIGNTYYWALWNAAYWLIKAVTYIAGWFLKYLVANIVSAIVGFINTVIDGIKRMMCVYVTYVSPFLTMYDGFKLMASGRKFVGVMEMVAGIFIPFAIVAHDCGIQSPVFSPAPSPSAPSPSPVYTAPPGYSYGYASVRVSDGFSATSLMKTLMLSDSVVVKDGGVI